MQEAAKNSAGFPAAVNAVQTFDDYLKLNPHCHMLASDGCFNETGIFTVAPEVDTKAITKLFRHKVLKMLLAEKKIIPDRIALMDKWRHSGFNVYHGPRILPN